MHRNPTRMSGLRHGASALIVLALAFPAFAQDDDSKQGIDEIIVTATKREQSIQDVPIAVSAFQADELENRGIDELEDLQQVSPSISVYGSNSSTNGGTIRIRGMGTTGNNPGLEAAVGSFIDGVYRSRSGQAYGDFVDIERIEILRGPQGTLFGKNTSAGAVHIITKLPSFEFGGAVTGSYGNFDAKKVTASVTGPLIADELAFRFSGSWHDRDGYYEDLNSPDAYNDRDRYSIRGQLLWQPSEDFSARLIADYTNADESCCPAGYQAVGPSGGIVQLLGGTIPTAFGSNTAASNSSNNPTPLSSLVPFVPGVINLTGNQVPGVVEDKREVGVNFKPEEDVDDWGVQLEMNLEWNEIAFTSITSYREFDAFRSQDIDFSDADILQPQDADDLFENFSQEFRAVGTLGELDWLVGIYGYTEDIETDEQILFSNDGGAFFSVAFGTPVGTLDGFFPNGVGYSAEWEQEAEGYAIFTNNVYHITEDLDMTFGVRYSREEKEGSGSINGGAPGQVVNQAVPNAVVPGMGWCEGATAAGLTILRTVLASLCDNQSWEKTQTEREWTGTIGLSYAVNEDLNTYISFSRGYKAGGFNLDQESFDAIICDTDGVAFDGLGNAITPGPFFGLVIPRVGVTNAGTPSECATQTPGEIGRIEDNSQFSPEFANAYELGVKGSFLEGTLVVNTAIFFTKFKDFQLNTFNGLGFTISNVSQVESYGFEIESFWTVTENLFVTMGVTYADTRYGDDINLLNPLDAPIGGNTDVIEAADGNRITQAPLWAGSMSFTYEDTIPGTEWTGFLTSNTSYRGRANTGSNLHPGKVEDDFMIFNARIGVTSPDGKWEVVGWVDNLTDKFVNTVVFDSVFQSGSLSTFFNPPRMFGVTVKYRFGERS